MNRKLFKPRTARNKLNQMGGIMASDAELMQTVARYNMGGPVGFNLGGSTELDNLRLDQRQLRLPQNQAFIEAMDNRVSGQNPRSVNLPRVTGISNVLKAAPRAALPAAVLAELADTALNTSVDREGIMATTPKFAGAEGQNRRPGITREQFDAMSPEDRQAYFQTEQDRLGAISGSISGAISGEGPLGIGGIAEELAIIPDMAQNLYEGVAGSDTVQRALKAAGILDPTSRFEKTRPRDFEERAVRTRAMNRPFESIEEFRASLPSAEGPLPAGRVVEPTAEYLQQLEQATGLPPGSIRLPQAEEADQPVPDMPDVMPESEAEARDKRRRSAEEAAATEVAGGQRPIPTEDETDYLEKYVPENLDEGDTLEMGLSEKERVEAAVKSKDKDFQQGELKRLMAEFTENAPQYEGMNRGLAIAKIGFAMAAGKSPNAISNIASALEQGADMFIKDKEKRDSFNRQVQLSALQYGLGEQSKDRAAKRAMQYQTAEYVLMPGESYTYPDGRTVTAKADGDGMTISLNKAEVLEKGLPDGVQGTNLATAILQKKATYEVAAAKAKKDATDKITVNDPKKITAFVDDYSKAANSAIQANNAMHLTRQVMVMNADGDVTGFRPGFNSALAKAMALAGVDATSYTDRDLAIADLRKVFQKLVPLTLGKDQSANSISNKDVDRLADAYMSAGILDGGITALMTTPANVLNSKLSGILTEFQSAEDQALAKLTSLEQTGNEFITPSGTNLGARVGEQRSRVQEVFPQKGVRPMLAVGDDGVFRLATGG